MLGLAGPGAFDKSHVVYRILQQSDVYSSDDEDSDKIDDAEAEKKAKKYNASHCVPAVPEQKLKYPKSVFFIILNEFCERFSYYGMRTVLALYLLFMLEYTEKDTKVIYHTFAMLVYFFPLVGAIIADSWLGKFRTILYIGIVYAIGNIVLSLSTIGPLGLPPREFALLGLMLIAIGTGGIKPCVASFGGDQFYLPQQTAELAKFFSIFYFAINAGALISTMLTPVLRENVRCFGANSCFPLAFGVPGILMIVSLIIFVAGKSMYRMKMPEGNVMVKVSKCLGHAIVMNLRNWKKRGTNEALKKNHWIEYADDLYDERLIEDIKEVMKVLIVLIPMPVFWALYDQQGSGWTFQATNMNGDLGHSYVILPDQMQVVNPLLILAFIPLFDYVLYPLVARCGLRRPLQKMTVGMLLAALSFFISALVEHQLEKTFPLKPQAGEAQLRLYNPLPCRFNGIMKPGDAPFVVGPYSMYAQQHLKLGKVTMSYKLTPVSSDGQCAETSKEINVTERGMVGQVLVAGGNAEIFKDSNIRSTDGYPVVRTIVNGAGAAGESIVYKSSQGKVVLTTNSLNYTTAEKLRPDIYTVEVGGKMYSLGGKLRLGGVYVIMIDAKAAGGTTAHVAVVTQPNSVHILWLVPQYIVITMGEIMFSVIGLSFSYSQSPTSMKSFVQACWLLTTALGNFIVVVIEKILTFESGVTNYCVYAALMIVCSIIFALLAKRYKYIVKQPSIVNVTDIVQQDTTSSKK